MARLMLRGLRAGSDVPFNGGTQRRGLALDVFNALNNNSITAIHMLSGPPSGRVIDLIRRGSCDLV
jgi:hypothetical protein